MTATNNAARERTVAEQLILDHAVMWLDRNAAAMALRQHDDPMWRVAAAGVIDGWAVLYLLLVLRQQDPAVAELAATFLREGAPTKNLPQFAADWFHAVSTGEAPHIPL